HEVRRRLQLRHARDIDLVARVELAGQDQLRVRVRVLERDRSRPSFDTHELSPRRQLLLGREIPSSAQDHSKTREQEIVSMQFHGVSHNQTLVESGYRRGSPSANLANSSTRCQSTIAAKAGQTCTVYTYPRNSRRAAPVNIPTNR